MEKFKAAEFGALGLHQTRDADILRALVFLEIFYLAHVSGRKYGRSFLDALVRFQDDETSAVVEPPDSSIVLP